MNIDRRLLAELLNHAGTVAPNECCGLIGGKGDEALTFYPAANAAANPTRFFEMDSGDQLRAEVAIKEAGQDLVAVYHSHTRSAAFPSEDDIAQADGEVLHVITSLVEAGTTRAFRISDGVTERVEISVT